MMRRIPQDSENIEKTHEIAELAHKTNISVEGEIGFVGYSEGAESQNTDPTQAKQFAELSGCDAMAISAGNIHLQTNTSSSIDLEVIEQIEKLTDVPLVLHGSSGIDYPLRRSIANNTNVCKFNIGTELRMVFGEALKESLEKDPTQFDRVQILSKTNDPIVEATRKVLNSSKAEKK